MVERGRQGCDYFLPDERLDSIEREIVDAVIAETDGINPPGLVPVWIDAKCKAADFVRTHEAKLFPEVTGLSDKVDDRTIFLAVVDTRGERQSITHGLTLNTPEKHSDNFDAKTGFYTIDNLIDRGNFSADEFRKYYESKGVDLSQTLSIETNFRIKEKTMRWNGVKSADVAYLAVFQLFMKSEPELHKSGIFATINEQQKKSLERLGLVPELLLGREHFDTEEAEFGIDSSPVFLWYTPESREIMIALGRIGNLHTVTLE